MGVSTVIRLNEERYAASDFKKRGLDHVDLPFPDCTAPPDAVVAAFLRAADAAPGAVAVHCRGGLGRTGTLIAVWLMRTHGFTAREAMGWLRIMRPGSVIGDQQRFLCHVGAALAAVAVPGSLPTAVYATPRTSAILVCKTGGERGEPVAAERPKAADAGRGGSRRQFALTLTAVEEEPAPPPALVLAC